MPGPATHNFHTFHKDKNRGVRGAQGSFNDYIAAALGGTLDQMRQPWQDLADTFPPGRYWKIVVVVVVVVVVVISSGHSSNSSTSSSSN